jgi:hypothetical protein
MNTLRTCPERAWQLQDKQNASNELPRWLPHPTEQMTLTTCQIMCRGHPQPPPRHQHVVQVQTASRTQWKMRKTRRKHLCVSTGLKTPSLYPSPAHQQKVMAHTISLAFGQTNSCHFKPYRNAPDGITPNRIVQSTIIQVLDVEKSHLCNLSPTTLCLPVATHPVSHLGNQS